ncbi:hypothetical protein [Nocardiopsis sp. CNT312]|uniref:hypothetical protein n=1 Tax=Nocardiopsis sp. CNT312 TaxID=1137268 RepID=UPI00048F425E|nr:hypothetical protein [Nocardiopsis sp. CNT312]
MDAINRIAAVAGTMALSFSLIPTAHADPAAPAEPAVAPPEALNFSQGSLLLENTGTAQTQEGMGASAACIFYTRGDHVHISSSAFEASGHGGVIPS